MIHINPYLNFMGKSEEAFNFYKSVFGGEFPMVMRFKDVKDMPDKDKLSEEDLNKIMHIALPIGGNMLMATDALESAGQTIKFGDNVSLSLSFDSKEETERVFKDLTVGGTITMPLQDMFWGDYFGMVDDKFGVKWMFSFQNKK